jgi:hypothetical protein
MSQHSQRTQQGPSVPSIIVLALITTVAIAATLYLASGPLDSRDLTGVVLGFVLTLVLVAQTANRIIERKLAAERAERAERAGVQFGGQFAEQFGERRLIRPADLRPAEPRPAEPRRAGRSAAGRAAAERAADRWAGPTPSRRVDPSEWDIEDQPPSESLLLPREQPVKEQPVKEQPVKEHGDQTQRLDPGAYRSAPASPASLRAIEVPVFRTEADRQIWAAEHGMPTEVIPRPQQS